MRPGLILLALLAGCSGCRKSPIPSKASSTEVAHVEEMVSAKAQTSAQTSAMASGSASGLPAESAPKKAPLRVENILLITVDTLRADQSWLGYDGAKTPILDDLVKRSVLFERVYSVANTTMPSLSSMMMAKYPTEIERDNCGLPAFWNSETIAEVMTKTGIHTVGFHGHQIFVGSFAPSKGFAEWHLIKNVLGRRVTDGAVTGEEIAELTIDFFQKNPQGRRFFAWTHFVDPHDSYVRHEDFPPGPSPRRGLYDGEVSYTDAQIGKVLTALKQANLSDTTAVLVTADHGESFGEHDRYRHGHTLHEEEIRVPFILHVPGLDSQRIGEPRSLIDVARTLSELVGVEPSAGWRGVSLLRDVEGAPISRPVLVDAPMLTTMMGQRAMIRGKEKLIQVGNSVTRFDMESDPSEQRPERLNREAPARVEMQQLFDAIPQVEAKPCYRKG